MFLLLSLPLKSILNYTFFVFGEEGMMEQCLSRPAIDPIGLQYMINTSLMLS